MYACVRPCFFVAVAVAFSIDEYAKLDKVNKLYCV